MGNGRKEDKGRAHKGGQEVGVVVRIHIRGSFGGRVECREGGMVVKLRM